MIIGAALVLFVWVLLQIPRGPVQTFEGTLIVPAVDLSFSWRPGESPIWIENANSAKQRFLIPRMQVTTATAKGLQADPEGPAMQVRLHVQKNILGGVLTSYLEIVREGWIVRSK